MKISLIDEDLKTYISEDEHTDCENTIFVMELESGSVPYIIPDDVRHELVDKFGKL